MGTISVIIATRGRWSDLAKTLESLRGAIVPKSHVCELLIVDNGPDDATRQVAEVASPHPMAVRYIAEHRQGKSHALNTGIREARGEVFVFIDDDLRAPSDWLVHMALPIIEKQRDAVVGAVLLHDEIRGNWLTHRHLDWMGTNVSLEDGNRTVLFPMGANFAASRAAIESAGFFDPKLGPGPHSLGNAEDSLLVRQLEWNGYKVLYQSLGAVLHCCDPGRISRQYFLHAAWNRGRSWAYVDYHWKHTSVHLPLLRLAKAHFKLSLFRIRRLLSATQGVAWDELSWVVRVSYLQQYIKERRRPRCYPKFGLKKLVDA